MCFGGKEKSSSKYSSLSAIYNDYKNASRINGDMYIDPDGDAYNRGHIVSCSECMFSFGTSRCGMFKEKGYSDSQILNLSPKVSSKKYCDYFLINSFDNSGEASDAAYEIKKKLYN